MFSYGKKLSKSSENWGRILSNDFAADVRRPTLTDKQLFMQLFMQ